MILFSFFLEIFKAFTIFLTLQHFMMCLKVGPFPSTVLGTQWPLNLEIKVFQFWEVFLSLFLSYFLSLLFWCSFSLGWVLFGCWASWIDPLIFCPLVFLFYTQGSFLTFSSKLVLNILLLLSFLKTTQSSLFASSFLIARQGSGRGEECLADPYTSFLPASCLTALSCTPAFKDTSEAWALLRAYNRLWIPSCSLSLQAWGPTVSRVLRHFPQSIYLMPSTFCWCCLSTVASFDIGLSY